MGDNMKDKSYDDISEMIENNAETIGYPSNEEIAKAREYWNSAQDEIKSNDIWLKRSHTLQAYTLDVVRDGSDEYFKKLTEAILAITKGDYGYIDYKGYKIFYTDTPSVRSISLKDGHREYCYSIGFDCDALRVLQTEEYHSEDERKAFLDPESELYSKTLSLLDKEIGYLDEGTWIKAKKKLNIYSFKDYSPDDLFFGRIEWDDRERDSADTFSFLIEDADKRKEGVAYTEEDFDIFAEVIRRMVFFADYGKRNSLDELEGLIRFKWRPTIKRDLYIWRCMYKFGLGDSPDSLLDSCAVYYFLDDPQGWEAMAYLLPIVALMGMRQDYDPDIIKTLMLMVFDQIPDKGYRERIEKLIEEDRAKAEKGGIEDDQEDD